jgi:hypothetical protein
MAAIDVRCRQCGWGTRIEAGNIPRYGARVRCPRCDALQLVPPGGPGPLAGSVSEGPPGERPLDAPSAAAELLAPASVSPTIAPEPPTATLLPEGSVPQEVDTPRGPDVPDLTPACDSARAQAEARRVVGLWIQEITRRGGGPPDARRVFGEYGEELARLYSLWSAWFPGEASRAVFRRELLAALGGLARGTAPDRADSADRAQG